jgi:NTP pyrophosphatase (non-canonical NTP hydrolase)
MADPSSSTSTDEETLDGYQTAARSFAIYPGQDSNQGVLYTTLGLAGEAGEYANKVKKLLRDGPTPTTQAGLEDELGDALWYVANAATELGVSLGDIAEANLNKLRSRSDAGTLRGSGDSR